MDHAYQPRRLNLGAGNSIIEGFEPRDGARGDCLFPLPDADGSIDEIRASHVLEHFSHRDVGDVLQNWVRKLAPGGRIRIAVPDFEKIAKAYLDGEDFNVQGYVHGGHDDARDRHACSFDRELLTELLVDCGLERIHDWTSEIKDCAALDISLNIGGYKPSGEQAKCADTVAILSAPRFGPVMHFRCAFQAFAKARVNYAICGGAYWHQVISESMECQLQDPALKYLITCDYDTVFTHLDVVELYRLMEALPQVDALCAQQMKRSSENALFSMRKKDGSVRTDLPTAELSRNVLRVFSGHFGLTIFRAESLRTFPRPWMNSTPGPDGRWGADKIDADIEFWCKWNDAGKTLYLAPRVVVGHLEEVIVWPSKALKPIYQTLSNYDTGGMPEGARR